MPQAAARTGPAIPGLEQGNPAVSNRPAQAPAGQAPTGQAQTTTQPAQPQLPEQIRQQIQEQIRLAIQEGGNPQIVIPTDFVRNAVPRGAVDISVAFFVMVAFIIVGLPIARAFGRRMDARSKALEGEAANLSPQIQQLQDSVDGMAVELERITEAQRFQSKLLAGREKEPERLAR